MCISSSGQHLRINSRLLFNFVKALDDSFIGCCAFADMLAEQCEHWWVVLLPHAAILSQGPLTAVSAFQSNWRRGVGFPLGSLDHGRPPDASAGHCDLHGEFTESRTTPAHPHPYVLKARYQCAQVPLCSLRQVSG
jgi:hypothetical protein